MKNLFLLFVLSAIVGFSSFTLNSNTTVEPENQINEYSDTPIPFAGPPWWKVALVDAGGALGGAGSVASGIGLLAVTPAAPIVVAGMVGGAIVGGGAASVAYAGRAATGNGTNAKNPLNEFDFVGTNHNAIVVEFGKTRQEVNSSNYYSFALKNPGKYNLDSEYLLDENYLTEEMNAVSELENVQDILSYISNRLPAGINKKGFETELVKLTKLSTKSEFVESAIAFENKFFKENRLNSKDNIALKSFFSTLRHSAVIW